jgi:hypothetical protein
MALVEKDDQFDEWEGEMSRLRDELREVELSLEICVNLVQKLLDAYKSDDVCVLEDEDSHQLLIVLPSDAVEDMQGS